MKHKPTKKEKNMLAKAWLNMKLGLFLSVTGVFLIFLTEPLGVYGTNWLLSWATLICCYIGAGILMVHSASRILPKPRGFWISPYETKVS